MKILTEKGFKKFDGFIERGEAKQICRIFFGRIFLDCTLDHRLLLSNNEYIEAQKLTTDHRLYPNIKINKVEIINKQVKTFDAVNVEDTHSYLTNGVISHNCLIIDEMGFIPNNIWTDFFSSVYPTVSSSKTSKTILVSTPNGMNHFYRYWIGATTTDPALRNTFNPIKVHWSEVPGRDEKWYKETLSNMTQEEFNREFEGEFLGSALTLLNINTLKQIGNNMKAAIPDTPLHDALTSEFSQFLRVFKKVKKGHRYIMSVDSAKVREDTSGDAIAIQVIDITRYPFKQVAVFQASDNMHYLRAPEVAYRIGTYYNNAYAFVENNEIGQEIADSIAFDFEYENLFFEKPNLAGYRTTKKTKRLGCSNLKGWIEKHKLEVYDAYTIEELSTFIKQKNGSFAAEEGYSDDLVMALMGCLFFTTRPEFDAFTDMKSVSEVLFNAGKEIEIEEALEEDLPAFGIMDVDGVDSMDENDTSWLF